MKHKKLPKSGRRSELYTDYTFAVWDGDNLPVDINFLYKINCAARH
ncbi:MAG: hypothetical protein ACYCZO_05175 [Daejeonella sp.]